MEKKISLTFVASPINIIFFCSHEKHNFLVPSLSHNKLSHFFSLLFAFSLIIYSLLRISSLICFFFKKFSVWWIPSKDYFFFFEIKNKYFIDVKENIYRVRHANTMHVTVPNQSQKLQKNYKKNNDFLEHKNMLTL